MEKYRYINQTKFKNHVFVQHARTFRKHRKFLLVRSAHAYERASNFLRPVTIDKTIVFNLQKRRNSICYLWDKKENLKKIHPKSED